MPKRSTLAKLSSAQERLRTLRSEAASGPRPEDFARELTALQEQLADLEVAYQELEQQNEQLRASQERLRHAQRLEAVGRLAGGIAHSFNNLLAAVAFQCELLEERLEEGDERRLHVAEIQKAGERAADLARQLLAFGRKQVMQPRVLGLNDVIRE